MSIQYKCCGCQLKMMAGCVDVSWISAVPSWSGFVMVSPLEPGAFSSPVLSFSMRELLACLHECQDVCVDLAVTSQWDGGTRGLN